MAPVTVLVLAPDLAPGAGPLERRLDAARTALAEHHRSGFLAASAATVVVRREPPDDTPFGARLRRLVGELRPAGLVVLGAGAIPLASAADRRAFVEAAAADRPNALANHRFSADAVAIACAGDVLRGLPDLRSDNALPRWMAEAAGVPVRDLAGRRRLAVDVDSPLDLLVLEHATGAPALPGPDEPDSRVVRERLAAIRALAGDARAELLVAGRTSAADLRWLERRTRSRTRALVEERGLRTASIAADVRGRPNRRPPRSVLGELLDRDGPEALGGLVARLADGALLDTRVLLAHRLGADERGWPPPEDRFASDLLLPDRVEDTWLRALTWSAVVAPVPILLGGHSLVGPGVRIALGGGRRGHRG